MGNVTQGSLFQVDLLPSSAANFTGPSSGQDGEPNGKLGGRMDVAFGQGLEKLGKLFRRNHGVMLEVAPLV